MRKCLFQAKNDPFAPNENFLQKTVNVISMYLLIHFMVQNLKNSLEWIQSYKHVPFLNLKWPICFK